MKEIEDDSLPDLIGLQELDHYYEFWKPKLSEIGYETIINPRIKKDSVLIGWKRNKFQLVEKQGIFYDDIIERYEK